jgi:hypothetical protein
MSEAPPTTPTTRADVFSELAHRFREQYGDRLIALYATQYDPYEPSEEEKNEPGVHIIVVLQGPYEPWTETDTVTDIVYDIMDQTDWAVPLVPHHVSHDSAVARRIGEEGVRLD